MHNDWRIMQHGVSGCKHATQHMQSGLQSDLSASPCILGGCPFTTACLYLLQLRNQSSFQHTERTMTEGLHERHGSLMLQGALCVQQTQLC